MKQHLPEQLMRHNSICKVFFEKCQTFETFVCWRKKKLFISFVTPSALQRNTSGCLEEFHNRRDTTHSFPWRVCIVARREGISGSAWRMIAAVSAWKEKTRQQLTYSGRHFIDCQSFLSDGKVWNNIDSPQTKKTALRLKYEKKIFTRTLRAFKILRT